MKTFIAAVIIFALLCASVCGVSVFVSHRLSELGELAAALPENEASFESGRGQMLAQIEEFSALWDRSMRVFPYVMDYEMLERADEAALALCSYAKSGESADFFAAKIRFSDSVERLRVLFGVHLESVA